MYIYKFTIGGTNFKLKNCTNETICQLAFNIGQ